MIPKIPLYSVHPIRATSFFSNISQKKNNNTHKLALLYINI